MTRLLIPLACMSLLGACTSTPEPASPTAFYTEPPALNSMDHPLRLSATQIGGELGGAAYRARAVEDVLLRTADTLVIGEPLAPIDPAYDRLITQVQQNNQITPSKPDNTKVAAAWRRYCNGGADMSDQDWAYVRAHGGVKGVPETLVSTCVYPK